MKDYYEPSDDTFVFVDYLLSQPKSYFQGVVMELGTGSGYITQTLSNIHKSTFFLATDINKSVPAININNYSLCITDMLDYINQANIRTIIFNPPYVHSDKIYKEGIRAALDGGHNGREVIDRFVECVNINNVYLLTIKVNKPYEVVNNLEARGYKAEIGYIKKILGEEIYIIKATKN